MIDWTHSQQALQQFIDWTADQAVNAAKIIVPIALGFVTLWLKKLYEKTKAESTMANLGMTDALVRLNVAKVEEKQPDGVAVLKHEAVKQAVLPKAGDAVKGVIDPLIANAVKDMNTEKAAEAPTVPEATPDGGG